MEKLEKETMINALVNHLSNLNLIKKENDLFRYNDIQKFEYDKLKRKNKRAYLLGLRIIKRRNRLIKLLMYLTE